MAFCSCEDYLSVDLHDQANLDEIFSQSTTTHRYLAHCYSYLPLDEEIVGSDGWVVARSDEALYSWYQWVYYLLYRTGNYGSSTPTSETYYNFWEKYYIAINQCTIFMDNVDKDKEDSPEIVKAMKAEARFLRAFYYFTLFRQYGPVFIWGDKASEEDIDPTTIDRHTVDQNINFIVEELDKAIADLPLYVNDNGEDREKYMGRFTKGAAMAVKSRVLIYAASPLYNGCELYKGKMKNLYGDYLFPQTADPKKWEAAAKAAKDVIDLGIYSLCKSNATGDAFKDGGASYEAVFFEPWNSETILGWWTRTSAAYDWMGGAGGLLGTSCPGLTKNGAIYQGYAGICPSLKLVDAYPMWETGRYPVKGYKNNNDYSQPIIDELSGYQATGFTEGYLQPLDADWAPAFKAHNSCVGRDPRYYACLVPNGFYWPNKTDKERFTCYNNDECSAPWNKSEGWVTRVGYTWRKWSKPDKSLRLGSEDTSYRLVHPEIRLAEIYLNYAEACNEMPQRDEAEALKYLNLVRNRVGLNNIEVAYPEIIGNKELLRWCIKKERMVELSMETNRHYDACRWMDAKVEYPCKNWTLHVSAETYEESYERVSTDFVGGDATFSDRDYLFPISVNQLNEMVNITQNYGF